MTGKGQGGGDLGFFFTGGEGEKMGLQIISYLCLIVFLSAVGLRIRKQWKMPVHFRWELYPVQHEPGEKASYGGSYMEEVNWWEKKRRKSLINEIQYMVP